MLKNYFKTAWRRLLRGKSFSIINILGLSIGMAGTILILLWLQNYSYRIDIGWGIFLAARLFAIVIALATASFQAIRSAVANPMKSLRTE
jgi:putative ABC transport system permease protein